MGGRGGRCRLRAAPPPVAPRRVPSHRPARPRPARGVRRGLRAHGRRALRCVRAGVADEPGLGDRAHRAVHDRHDERGGAGGQARVRRAPQRARGLRAAHGVGVRARRRRHARAAHAVRAVAARGRVGGGRACGCATASRCARCGTRRWSARTCRARSGGCCGCRSCRFRRSPIRRSRCCTPTTRPRRWSPRSTAATTARSTSSGRARPRPGRPCASAGACRCRWSDRCGRARRESWSWPAPRSRRT